MLAIQLQRTSPEAEERDSTRYRIAGRVVIEGRAVDVNGELSVEPATGSRDALLRALTTRRTS
jgi:hypothetical protein